MCKRREWERNKVYCLFISTEVMWLQSYCGIFCQELQNGDFLKTRTPVCLLCFMYLTALSKSQGSCNYISRDSRNSCVASSFLKFSKKMNRDASSFCVYALPRVINDFKFNLVFLDPKGSDVSLHWTEPKVLIDFSSCVVFDVHRQIVWNQLLNVTIGRYPWVSPGCRRPQLPAFVYSAIILFLFPSLLSHVWDA